MKKYLLKFMLSQKSYMMEIIMIELASLPLNIQEQIINAQQPIVVSKNGKVIGTFQPTPNHINGDFNYDLAMIQESIESGFVRVPTQALTDSDAFEQWLFREQK